MKGRRSGAVVALLAVGLAALAVPAAGRVLLTVDEALELAFPGCTVERGTVYLTDEERRRAAELAGEEIPTRIVHPYVATCEGAVAGTAYFDAHRVRTLPETLMIVVDPQARVRRVEVLSFAEPPDYLPREAWYEQFVERELAPELDLQRAIHPVTGATLTAVATTTAVRRVLAVHRVLGGEGDATPEDDGP